jgi:hypothetical protein
MFALLETNNLQNSENKGFFTNTWRLMVVLQNSLNLFVVFLVFFANRNIFKDTNPIDKIIKGGLVLLFVLCYALYIFNFVHQINEKKFWMFFAILDFVM